MTNPSQEPQSERATLTLTRAEKDALRLVAIMDEVSESSLLRDFTVSQIVERADSIRSRAQTEVA